MKKFSKFEIATIKRTAQSVNPMVTKKNKIKAQIDELSKEYTELDNLQESYESAIKAMTGGYGTEDLIDKVVEESGSLDKNGKPIKVTKYVLKYPETIIPEAAENMEGIKNTNEVDDSKLEETEENPSSETAYNPLNA